MDLRWALNPVASGVLGDPESASERGLAVHRLEALESTEAGEPGSGDPPRDVALPSGSDRLPAEGLFFKFSLLMP